MFYIASRETTRVLLDDCFFFFNTHKTTWAILQSWHEPIQRTHWMLHSKECPVKHDPARQVTLLLSGDRRCNSILLISMPSATWLEFVTVGSSAIPLQRTLLCKSWGSVAKAAHSRHKMTKCIFSKKCKKRKNICLYGRQKSNKLIAPRKQQVEITSEYFFPLERVHPNIVFFLIIIFFSNKKRKLLFQYAWRWREQVFGKCLSGSLSNRIGAWDGGNQ